ncbi:MAG: hypothetical protein WC631_03460 [Candidatus Paceibacterota bacterium]|jgi:hypothetical protein
MTKFLPGQLKDEVKKEYLSRLFIVFLFLLLVVMIISICFLLPSSFLSKVRGSVVDQQLSSIKTVTIKGDSSFAEDIKKINETISALSLSIDNKDQLNSLLKKMLAVKNGDIRISAISLSIDPNRMKVLSVRGISAARDSLIMFVKDIKSLGIFNSVDFPVSNLIKNSNVDFTIGLILNK